ncbi:MAG TPA: hypothetical protein VKT32_04070 [Chthonomonadaceae bacterium]|nr:hypothetical protein [Chthonomonadaceae bacterium]
MRSGASAPDIPAPSHGPPSPAKAPPLPPWSLFRNGYRRVAGWGFALAAALLVDSFLLFESTMDVRIYGLERLRALQRAGHRPLLVIWHGQGLLPMTTFRQEHLCLYASHTREESYSRVLRALRWWTLRLIERMGYAVLDAAQFKSESRGVLKFVDVLRSGTGSVIAADGPAGPIFQAKPGPVFLAKKAGVVLMPVGSALARAFQLDNWDRFEVPWPFTQAVLVLGEPLIVPADSDEARLEQFRRELESRMRACVEEAERRI